MITTEERTEKEEEKEVAAILEKFGLSWAKIESTNGLSASDSLANTISYINVDSSIKSKSGCSNLERAVICSALLTWQSTTPNNTKHSALFSDTDPCYIKILSVIQNILKLSNDTPPSYKYGMQMPGLYLSQLLLRASKESITQANELSKPIAKNLELTFTMKTKSNSDLFVLNEDNPTAGGISREISLVSADSVRAETVKNLVKSISDQLENSAALEVSESLLRVLSSCLPRAPKASEELANKLSCLLLSNPHLAPSSMVSRLGPHCSVLVEAIRRGHLQLLPLLQAHPQLLLPHSTAFSMPSAITTTNDATKLLATLVETLLTAVGVTPLTDLLVAVAEKDARVLIRCVSFLVLHLESSSTSSSSSSPPSSSSSSSSSASRQEALQTQQLVLDLLLAVALADPAAVARHLPAIQAVCCPLTSPSGLPPPGSLALLRLLAAVGTRSREEAVTTQCMAAVARTARRHADRTDQPEDGESAVVLGAAILEALNVLKDHCKFCNVFHRDTLAALERLKGGNERVHRNLTTWNRGDKAWRGDLQHFLLTAGQPPGSGGALELLRLPPSRGRWWRGWWGGAASASASAVAPCIALPASSPATSSSAKRPASAPSAGYWGKSGGGGAGAVAPSPLFNRGKSEIGLASSPISPSLLGAEDRLQDLSLPSSPPSAEVAKNLFGEAGQYVSFSEFIARQKSQAAGERPGSAATVTAGYQQEADRDKRGEGEDTAQKSHSLALPSEVGGEEKSVGGGGHIGRDG